ncbi:hypothetical protein NN561_016090 [Cricetulus griseus]
MLGTKSAEKRALLASLLYWIFYWGKCPNCVLLMIGLPSMSLLEMLHRELDLPALSTAPSHCLRKSNVPLSHRSQKKTSELLEQEYEWLWICIWSSETEPGSSTRVHLHQIT